MTDPPAAWLAGLTVLVGAGGACARAVLVARYGTTAVVNLPGALALGVLVGLQPPAEVLLVAGAGALGAFTTFSTWMVDAARRDTSGIVRTIAGQLLGGLLAAAAGLAAGAALR